jgi:hypothetical protein
VDLSLFLSFGYEFSRVAVIGDPCILGILAAERLALAAWWENQLAKRKKAFA